MHTNSLRPTRAVVLGGGGSTGNAWLIGLVAGLHARGVDVTDADLTIGTSAGATAAAQLASTTPADLFAATVAPGHPFDRNPARSTAAHATPAGSAPTRRPAGPTGDHLHRLRRTIASSTDAADYRRRIAAAALERDAASDGAESARWRAITANRLPGATWTERRIVITAIDARSGEPVLFERDRGVDLVDAVAASTAGGAFPTRIGDGRYLDGGYRANADNADLAVGFDRVLVLSPLGGRALTPEAWGTHLSTQVAQVQAAGGAVEVLVPRDEDEHLFGANAMDASLRPAAARAGFEQGSALADRIAGFWR